jgi:hypothetical protein
MHHNLLRQPAFALKLRRVERLRRLSHPINLSPLQVLEAAAHNIDGLNVTIISRRLLTVSFPQLFPESEDRSGCGPRGDPGEAMPE